MEVKQDTRFATYLVALASVQILIMIIQKRFGTSFFLPKLLRPSFYLYERKLDCQIDLVEDCAICMDELSKNDENCGKNVEVYLETPCGHKFHS